MPRVTSKITTSATTQVVLNANTYNEQTSGAGRSIKSSSANDAAAGTGAQTVLLTYYTLASNVIAGPFTETLTLNGVTAVATVNTNIALVEKMEVVTVGSGGTSAGTITLYSANDGSGTAIAAIATGDKKTYFSHHYIPSGKRMFFQYISGSSGEAAGSVTALELRTTDFSITNPVQKPVSSLLAAIGLNGETLIDPLPNTFPSLEKFNPIAGPAKVNFFITPAASTSQTTLLEYSYYEL